MFGCETTDTLLARMVAAYMNLEAGQPDLYCWETLDDE